MRRELLVESDALLSRAATAQAVRADREQQRERFVVADADPGDRS